MCIDLYTRCDFFLVHYLEKEVHPITAHKIKHMGVFLKIEDSEVVSAYIQGKILITIRHTAKKHYELLPLTTIILC